MTLVHFWIASFIMLEAGPHDDIIGVDQFNLVQSITQLFCFIDGKITPMYFGSMEEEKLASSSQN